MSYKIASPLASYTVDELVSSKAGPQGTAAYDEMVYDPVAQDRLSAEFSLSLEVNAEITTVILVDLSGSTGQGIGQAWPSGESYSMADLFYEEVKALVRALPNRDVVILGYGSYNGDGWLGEKHGRYTRRLSLDRDESWRSMGGTIPISSELIQAIHTKVGGYGTSAHTPIQIINISDGLPMDYLPLNMSLSAETFNAEKRTRRPSRDKGMEDVWWAYKIDEDHWQDFLRYKRRNKDTGWSEKEMFVEWRHERNWENDEEINYYLRYFDNPESAKKWIGGRSKIIYDHDEIYCEGNEDNCDEHIRVYGMLDNEHIDYALNGAGMPEWDNYPLLFSSKVDSSPKYHAEEFGAQTEAKRALKLLRRKSSKQRTQNRKQARKVKADKYGSEERAETDSSKGFIADANYGAGATFGVIGALFTGGFLMSLLGRRL